MKFFLAPRSLISTMLALTLLGCGVQQTASPGPRIPPEYAALPDTSVCVLDRSTPLGLREISAKQRGADVVLLVDGEVRSLESVHPINVVAGYAGREAWLTRGEQIALEGNRFVRTGGERRVAANLLRRAGEYQGILLFAGADDPPPPDALYVPTAPGCIFQAYVRSDLVRQ